MVVSLEPAVSVNLSISSAEVSISGGISNTSPRLFEEVSPFFSSVAYRGLGLLAVFFYASII